MPTKIRIRPYARLLTMLGEQLIKNERIALAELIKNSYDADASWVKITFNNFGENFEINDVSTIEIEDDGTGMSTNTIIEHWLNPATPHKRLKKEKNDTTKKGRKIQGEKGIGRFALLKLGRKIQLVTKTSSEKKETYVELDLTKYDDEFLTESGKRKELFLDDIAPLIKERDPVDIVPRQITLGRDTKKRRPSGTKIIISSLKGVWSEEKITKVYDDIVRLESIFSHALLKKKVKKIDDKEEFSVHIFKDDMELPFSAGYFENLETLIRECSVFQIEDGEYIEKDAEFKFKLNGKPKSLKLDDPTITGLRVFREHFGTGGEKLKFRNTKCGDFGFGFYVFDFSPSEKVKSKYQLDKQDKELIRKHRIYLYRDDIRVYPYGDPDDDWLRIDAYRGTISAGQFLSNDQVVGFVNISQKNNPELKDKTNREGLIDTGNPTDDFICLLQTFLAYIRAYPYTKYRKENEEKNAIRTFKTEAVKNEIDQLRPLLENNKAASERLKSLEDHYSAEKSYLVQRAETTEELAGVGLSVETASHDIMSIMAKSLISVDSLIKTTSSSKNLNKEILTSDLTALRGMLSFIEAQLKNIQLLFKSTKQRRKNIRIDEILEKVIRIFKSILEKSGIQVELEKNGSPLLAKTTDAVLLQLFLNLFDNSIFWLSSIDIKNRKILITLDGNNGCLIFSDNGPGIRKEDEDYIFEPFFSGKGEEGRGLGLYIAKQLLERHEYSIDLADLKSQKKLAGANFVISFLREE